MSVSTEGGPGNVVLAVADGASAPVSNPNEGRFRYDPGAGRLEFSQNGSPWTAFSAGGTTATAVESGSVYSCPTSVAVGDAVQITGADAVDKADASVPASRPVIGFVKSKPTTTSCMIHYYGEMGGFAGLAAGSTYYLSDVTPGAITTTAPSAIGSIVQEVGFARNSTTLVVLIDPDFTQL
jgi:hypothetical protein